MPLSPNQLTAFRDTVVQILALKAISPELIGWEYEDEPRDQPIWVQLNELASVDISGPTELSSVDLRQKVQFQVTADAAATITIDPDVTGGVVTTVAAGPSGSVTALRDALLVLLQAAGDPLWAAVAVDADVIEVEATEAGRGIWLRPSETGPITRTLLRDYSGVLMRDLTEVTMGLTLFSRLDSAAPSHAQRASVLVEAVRALILGPTWRALLTAAFAPVLRRGQVQDISRMLGGSQWETGAALQVTLSRMSLTVDQPGTIESMDALGVLSPGALQVAISAP